MIEVKSLSCDIQTQLSFVVSTPYIHIPTLGLLLQFSIVWAKDS